MMIAGKSGIRVMGQTGVGTKPMMTARRVYLIYRRRDGYGRWVMVSSGSGARLIDRTGACVQQEEQQTSTVGLAKL